jgi:hypothetical protein
MKLSLVGVGLAIALFAMPAMALTTVIDSGNPPGEDDLYEIYNSVYGTGFSSTMGATVANTSGGMDGLQVTEVGTFGIAAGVNAVTLVNVFAGNTQRFGYYNNVGAPAGDSSTATADGDFNQLFDVPPDPDGSVDVVLGPGPIGLYLYTDPSFGSNRTWFSEQILNTDAADHMVVYFGVDDQGNVLDGTGDSGVTSLLIAFEDRGLLGDTDYNDIVVTMTFVGVPTFTPPVPEPATAGLLLIGLAGLAARRRFRA